MKLGIVLLLLLTFEAHSKSYDLDPELVTINYKNVGDKYGLEKRNSELCSNTFSTSLLSRTKEAFAYSIYYQDVLASRPIFDNYVECKVALDKAMKLHSEATDKGLMFRVTKDSLDLPQLVQGNGTVPVKKLKQVNDCIYKKAFEQGAECNGIKTFVGNLECVDDFGFTASVSVICQDSKLPSAKDCYNRKMTSKELSVSGTSQETSKFGGAK